MRKLVQTAVILLMGCLCVGLLVPNICKVRTAAARIQCQNNCKQLGIAVHGYHDTHDHLVRGVCPNPNLPPDQWLSWCYSLAPYLERDDLVRNIDHGRAWDAEENRPLTHQRWKAFTCPTAANFETTYHTSYIGVAGVGADAATLPTNDPRIGAFGYDRTLQLSHLTDGASTMILLLETRSGGPWAQSGPGTVRGLDPTDRPHHGPGRYFDAEHFSDRFFSRTRTGITMTMCDGSVRTLLDTVAPEVLEALATVRGGEILPGDW